MRFYACIRIDSRIAPMVTICTLKFDTCALFFLSQAYAVKIQVSSNDASLNVRCNLLFMKYRGEDAVIKRRVKSSVFVHSVDSVVSSSCLHDCCGV